MLPANDVIPPNSEEGTYFLNVILPIAYSKLYRDSGPNKMAPLASFLWERETVGARTIGCSTQSFFLLDQCNSLASVHVNNDGSYSLYFGL